LSLKLKNACCQGIIEKCGTLYKKTVHFQVKF